MVALGICATTGFQLVRGQSQRENKFEKYSTFNETLTCPVSPVDG